VESEIKKRVEKLKVGVRTMEYEARGIQTERKK